MGQSVNGPSKPKPGQVEKVSAQPIQFFLQRAPLDPSAQFHHPSLNLDPLLRQRLMAGNEDHKLKEGRNQLVRNQLVSSKPEHVFSVKVELFVDCAYAGATSIWLSEL